MKKKQETLLTTQQEQFLLLYLSPDSPTYSNALQSALASGYSQEYAENITHLMPKWLSENIGDKELLDKALSNVKDALDGKLDDHFGAKHIKWKATEMVAKGLQKGKWSERKEFTGEGGKPLVPPTLSQEEKDRLLKLLKDK